ncbi:MAG TPA: hypothetical protein VJ771_05195 [Candidatus Nitrosotalea sp.]|nr:hypothetical protein [Candidatus Nitrosotalea sp.]
MQKKSTNNLSTYRTITFVPRKEYKSITVKNECYEHFKRAVRDAKKKDKSLDNSMFLDLLVTRHLRGKK